MKYKFYFGSELLGRFELPIKALDVKSKTYKIGSKHYEVVDGYYDVTFGGYSLNVEEIRFQSVIDCDSYEV